MHLPEHIQIGPTPYRVEYREDMDKDGQLYYGWFDPDAHMIQVWTGLPRQRQFVTLIHEAIHAIERDRQLDLEEREVDALAKGIAAFLFDNNFVTT